MASWVFSWPGPSEPAGTSCAQSKMTPLNTLMPWVGRWTRSAKGAPNQCMKMSQGCSRFLVALRPVSSSCRYRRCGQHAQDLSLSVQAPWTTSATWHLLQIPRPEHKFIQHFTLDNSVKLGYLNCTKKWMIWTMHASFKWNTMLSA